MVVDALSLRMNVAVFMVLLLRWLVKFTAWTFTAESQEQQTAMGSLAGWCYSETL
jgi:hypothetical protein